jgi:hypothetical protein
MRRYSWWRPPTRLRSTTRPGSQGWTARTVRGVLLQGQVGSGPVVVVQVPGKDAFQMALSQDNHVVEALTSYRADDSFRIGILPR